MKQEQSKYCVTIICIVCIPAQYVLFAVTQCVSEYSECYYTTYTCTNRGYVIGVGFHIIYMYVCMYVTKKVLMALQRSTHLFKHLQ